MPASLGLCLALLSMALGEPQISIMERGNDPSPGLLVNRTAGARPFDPPNPALPTFVFVHGCNPVPQLLHFVMDTRLSEAIQARGGLACNVLGWDWNASTFESLRPSTNVDLAIGQGRRLGASLIRAGLDPARVHLIGQSSGAIVATSAAEYLARTVGQPVAQLTMLDAARPYHDQIFVQMAAGTLCPVVENYWASGRTGYGREELLPGIRNYRVDAPANPVALINPSQSDHLGLVRWYLRTAQSPGLPYGFNTSSLLSGTN